MIVEGFTPSPAEGGWILRGNRQGSAVLCGRRNLFPALHGLWTDAEKVCEYDLTCVQAFSVLPISAV